MTDADKLRLGRLRVALGRLKRALDRRRAEVLVKEAAERLAEALAEWMGEGE